MDIRGTQVETKEAMRCRPPTTTIMVRMATTTPMAMGGTFRE